MYLVGCEALSRLFMSITRLYVSIACRMVESYVYNYINVHSPPPLFF